MTVILLREQGHEGKSAIKGIPLKDAFLPETLKDGHYTDLRGLYGSRQQTIVYAGKSRALPTERCLQPPSPVVVALVWLWVSGVAFRALSHPDEHAP